MKKIRYVEAMVTNDTGATNTEGCSTSDWWPKSISGMRAAMVALGELTSEAPMHEWLDAVAVANGAWVDVETEIENHECECDLACEDVETSDPVPIEAVGGTVSIQGEIDRLWLPGDELAILKLSDLRDLIGERERNDNLCYYVTGEAPA